MPAPRDRRRVASHRVLRSMHKVAAGLRLHPLLGWSWGYWRRRRYLGEVTKLLPRILAAIPPPDDLPAPTTWTVHHILRTVADTTVAALGPPGWRPVAVLMLPRSGYAATTLQRRLTVLAALNADPRLHEWRVLLPPLLAEGALPDQPYLVERMLPGLDARQIVADPRARARMRAAAATTIGELHRRTATPTRVDAALLQRWIDEPLDLIRRLDATHPEIASARRATERLAVELHDALAGRTLALSWVHGDYTPGNILVTPDGATLTGIVDWELAAPRDLPLLDLVQLMLSIRMLTTRRELGDVLRGLLNGAGWTPPEQAILAMAQAALPGDAVEPRTMLLLSWLRHIEANLTKSIRYAGNWVWVTRNIEAVLRYL